MRKVGGIWFFRWGRFGGSIYLAREGDLERGANHYIAGAALTLNLCLAAWAWMEVLR